MASYPQNPFSVATVTRDKAASYLTRIKLPHTLLDAPPTLELLSQLFLAQLENVPKDTSALHAPAADVRAASRSSPAVRKLTHPELQWDGPSVPIVLGSSFTGMPVGAAASDLIVKKSRGAFCFSINATLAAFLRFWGYRVSEMVTRCYKQ